MTTSYDDAVEDALDRMDDLGFEWGDLDFVNHGPMAAEALAVLGFADRVPRWADGYHRRPHHDPPAPRFALDADTWPAALGAFDRVGDWEVLFTRELAEEPWRDVLARWWPRLLPGLLAGLTHGVIRVAHAVRGLAAVATPSERQLRELSRGLAYWAARYRTLPGRPTLQGTRTVAEAVAALPRPSGAGGSLDSRLAGLSERPGYTDGLSALAPDDVQHLITEMTVEFAGVYLAHPEVPPVPLVHAVTAPAAVRLVLPHLPTAVHEPSVAALWQVHQALLLMFTGHRDGEAEALARAAETEQLGFVELAERAAEHGDEHVLKFTEAALREHGLRPDPRFPAAVGAALERIDRPGDL